MESRQQDLYSSVLSEAVVDWGSMGPGEEWVNSATHEWEQGLNQGTLYHLNAEDLPQTFQNGQMWIDQAVLHQEELGKMSPPEQDHWGHSTVSQCDSWVMSTTWDMQLDTTGFLDSDPLGKAEDDIVSEVNLNNAIMTEEEREEFQQELVKLEEEISTLKQVLASKEKQHAELRQKLGITPLSELRNNFSRGWQDMQSSTAYKKTSETLSTAGQKTSAAFSNLGSTITRKFGDMSYSIKQSMSMPTMRNSPSFKSFEEKMENTVSTIKTKVGSSGTGGSFEEVLSSAAKASSLETPTSDATDTPERQC